MRQLLPSLAAAQMLGIAAADGGWLAPGDALALGVAAAAAGSCARRRAWLRTAAALLAAGCAGALALGEQLASAAHGRPAQPFDCLIEGSVEGVARGPGWFRVDLAAVTGVGTAAPPLPERVRVRGETTLPGLPAFERRLPGERVRAALRLRAPAELRNPGARPRLRELARAGIGAEARLQHPALHVRLPEREGPRPLARLHAARAAWSARMAAAGPGSELLRALALGDRAGLTREQRAAFARLGISHVLAVSGLHLLLVASLGFGGARALASRSVQLAARWDTRVAALGVALVAAAAYALLAGWGVPVRRALVLLLALAAGVVGRRPRALLPPLAAAAIAVLAVEPQALFAPGAQLSFVASLALAVAARRHSQAAVSGPRGGGWLRASASAVAATAPLVALHLGRVAPFGLLANLAAVPWTACVLLPAAGLSLLASALPRTATTDTLLYATAAPARATSLAVAWLSDALPAPAATGPIGLAGWLVVAGLVALSFAARRTDTRVALALAVTAVLAFAPVTAIVPPPPRAVFFEVGQGDASLVQSRGAAVLIDAARARPGGLDLGASVVVPALVALGVRQLDLVVVSHADLDHRGGVPAVLSALPVGEVWVPHGASAQPPYGAILAAARAGRVPLRERGAGSDAAAFGTLRVTPLWPPPPAGVVASRNDRSLVVRVEVGGRRLLLPGDLEVSGEAALVASGADLRADVLKLGHHGSRTSSSEAFLAAVGASVALASAPCHGRFGMPHPEVVQRLHQRTLPLWWTGRDGAVMLQLGGPLAVWPFAARPERQPPACGE